MIYLLEYWGALYTDVEMRSEVPGVKDLWGMTNFATKIHHHIHHNNNTHENNTHDSNAHDNNAYDNKAPSKVTAVNRSLPIAIFCQNTNYSMKIKGRWEDYALEGNRRRRETTRDQRQQVITLRNMAGMRWKEIAERVNIDYRTCQKIYQRAMIYGSPSNQPSTGRPVLIDNVEKERLVAFIKQDQRTSRLQREEIIAEMNYNCSVKTLRDTLASLGYHKRLPRKKLV
ncbi:hypothetical protein HOY82DRAFT_539332 [Tuber indicum]|nr:hypothetical protein HOY82DRAFT_539332 [Tuber indicum]